MREPYVVEGHFAFISQSCDTSGNINVMWPSLSLSCNRNQHDIKQGKVDCVHYLPLFKASQGSNQ